MINTALTSPANLYFGARHAKTKVDDAYNVSITTHTFNLTPTEYDQYEYMFNGLDRKPGRDAKPHYRAIEISTFTLKDRDGYSDLRYSPANPDNQMMDSSTYRGAKQYEDLDQIVRSTRGNRFDKPGLLQKIAEKIQKEKQS